LLQPTYEHVVAYGLDEPELRFFAFTSPHFTDTLCAFHGHYFLFSKLRLMIVLCDGWLFQDECFKMCLCELIQPILMHSHDELRFSVDILHFCTGALCISWSLFVHCDCDPVDAGVCRSRRRWRKFAMNSI
jgi:hypothetical protein